jgi:TIR domain
VNETDWQDLLYAIEEGKVVPIVGRDLLIVETADGPQPFHRVVATRLAEELGIAADRLPPDFDANDVACAQKEILKNPADLNRAVNRILRSLVFQPPEPLKTLAEIPTFQLFVSTTVDTLLEDALAQVRGARPAVVSCPPSSEVLDFDEAAMKAQGSLVFHILGLVSASSDFAVTEGQMLEQMHIFMIGDGRPLKLIAKLQKSHLLILGVSFPSWLARFVLRIARNKPLWEGRQITEVFADGGSLRQDFTDFLTYFSSQQSHIYTSGSPVDFVHELNSRWFKLHPRDKPAAPPGMPSDWKPGCVFISYASEDREYAVRLADQLTKSKLEVWIDRRLTAGDDYNARILFHIRESAAFVAVLSQNTNNAAGPGRYFSKEWFEAVEVDKGFTGQDRRFLFPVIVDGSSPGSLGAIQKGTFGTNIARATGGEPPPDLIEQLDTAQKAYRKGTPRS